MKKIACALLILSASASIFAGDIPLGGRTCPNNQTSCLTSAPTLDPNAGDVKLEIPIYKQISVILKFIFG